MVQVVSIGREGRSAVAQAAHHQDKTVHHRRRDEKDHECRRDRMLDVLSEPEARPGDNEPQKLASGIAEKYLRICSPRRAQIEREESGERPEEQQEPVAKAM